MTDSRIRVRLLFADEGAYHHEELELPTSVVEDHDRLIDGLREDPELLKRVYVDTGRLCGAWVVEDG
jgi:hypothetical protein